MSEYWKISVEEALSESGIAASQEQTAELTKLIQGAAEMEREASGYYEVTRASTIPKPKLGFGKPYERGGSYYMDGSAPDVPYYVEDRDSGKTYRFHNKLEADNFYEANH